MFRHTDISQFALWFQLQFPAKFALMFIVPTWAEVRRLAVALGLPAEITARDGHRCTGAEGLLVYLCRLHSTGNMRELSEIDIFMNPGCNWSTTKLKEILREVGQTIHARHGDRISWSSCCFARAAHYTQIIRTKVGGVLLALLHPFIAFFIDGKFRDLHLCAVLCACALACVRFLCSSARRVSSKPS